MITDPHAALRDQVLQSVIRGPGESESAVREAAAGGAGVPDDLQSLISKIHAHAYKVTDEDIDRLKASYTEDQLFEIVVSAALGASRHRLLAGLAALERA
jgi:hypothetical protein